MYEREEVTLSTSSRKRRYKTSFRYSMMKELKRESKKREQEEGSRHQCKKTLTFPEKNQEMGSIAGSMTGDGISEIEEEKDGKDEPGNIIMVSSTSSLTSLSVYL
jgi:hypothetical protein